MAYIDLELEYQIGCPPSTLYGFIATASGLGEWFANKVTQIGRIFTFEWEGSEEKAEMLETIENEFVLFKWIGKEDAFFEFAIETNPITNETILIVFDTINEGDETEQTDLWNSQIFNLKHRLGL